jgi:hypothetical protein
MSHIRKAFIIVWGVDFSIGGRGRRAPNERLTPLRLKEGHESKTGVNRQIAAHDFYRTSPLKS